MYGMNAVFCSDTLDHSIIDRSNTVPFKDFEKFIKSDYTNKLYVIPENYLINYQHEQHLQQFATDKEQINFVDFLGNFISQVEDIKKHNIEIVFDIATAGFSVDNFYHIFDTIIKYGVNPSNVTVIVNTLNELNNLQDLINQYQLQISVININRNELILVEDYFSYKRSKRFLFLCRRWTPERFFIFLDLHKRKLLDNTEYSFTFETDPYQFSTKVVIDDAVKNFIAHHKTTCNKNYIDELIEYYNSNKHDIHTNGANWFGKSLMLQHDATLSSKFYDTSMSLCLETNLLENNPYFQPSEKIYKCCFFRHPFFVYSTQNFLKYWNITGYKSFANVFNEDYDTVSDPLVRFKMINDQVEYLSGVDHYTFMTHIHKCQEILNHNQQLIAERFISPRQKNITINHKSLLDSTISQKFNINQYED